MAINFGDSSVQTFSSKIIQVKRALRATQITTSSSSYSDVTSLDFTPKSSSSVIHCEFTGNAYVEEEPGGVRLRFYDNTDSDRFGTSLHASESGPLVWRFDFQGGHTGAIYSYGGIIWRAQESSWGTSSKNIKVQLAQGGNGTVGFISEYLPCTFTITEVME